MTYSMKKSAILFISEILSAREKSECYEEVPNHTQRIFTVIQNNNYVVFLTFMTYYIENRKMIHLKRSKDTLRMVGYLDLLSSLFIYFKQ